MRILDSVIRHIRNIGPLSTAGLIFCAVYLLLVLAFSAFYHWGLPDIKPLLSRPLPQASPRQQAVVLAGLGCRADPEAHDPLALYQGAFQQIHTGCSVPSRQLARVLYRMARHHIPSPLEEAMLATRLENTLPPAALLGHYLTLAPAKNHSPAPVTARQFIDIIAPLTLSTHAYPLRTIPGVHPSLMLQSPNSLQVQVEPRKEAESSRLAGQEPKKRSRSAKAKVRSRAARATVQSCPPKETMTCHASPGNTSKRWKRVKGWAKRSWRKVKHVLKDEDWSAPRHRDDVS